MRASTGATLWEDTGQGLTEFFTLSRKDAERALMEGVAFSLRDSFSIFSELSVPVERVVLGGGGARSALWRQIQADVYGRAVHTVAVDEGAAYGAALLAGVGAGIWPTVDQACEAVVRNADEVRPRQDAVAVMNDRYDEYRRVYPALTTIARAAAAAGSNVVERGHQLL